MNTLNQYFIYENIHEIYYVINVTGPNPCLHVNLSGFIVFYVDPPILIYFSSIFQADTNCQLDWLKDIKEAHGSVEVTSMMQMEAINSDGTFTVGRRASDKHRKDVLLELNDLVNLICTCHYTCSGIAYTCIFEIDKIFVYIFKDNFSMIHYQTFSLCSDCLH